METFPANEELLEFFQVEPACSESDGTPWVYCRLEFSVKLGEERVDCVIDNPELEVRWFRNDVEVAFLSLCYVRALSIQEYPGGKCLVAEGVGPKQEQTFRLQLRPRVHQSLKSSI